MATLEQLSAALVKADAAGNTDDARALAAEIRKMKGAEQPAEKPSFGQMFKKEVLDSVPVQAGLGALRGAAGIGATLLTPIDAAMGNTTSIGNPERRGSIDAAMPSLGANPDSMSYGAGRLGAEIAGTAGIGGAIAKPVGAALSRVAPSAAAPVVNALSSAGMTTGANAVTRGGKLADLALRTGAGAVVGGAAAGAVNPEGAGIGALVGGAAPGVLKGLGAAGGAIGGATKRVLRSGVSDDVAQLARRAKELGVDIPADRLVDSKPLNALTAGLNYTPFSGRAATEAKMNTQLNQALSRTFGQDSSNVTQALRKAEATLGGEFERTLKNNVVKFDKQLFDDAAAVLNRAERELGSDALKPIAGQVDELISKGASGQIDGQAAYNIKKTLDRLGRGNGNEAYHAVELKKVLMEALDRSLGPKEAAAFAKTRQQYGNMLALEKLAKNGVEGEISVARLANMKNINNEPLQELADIAAQFVKAREGAHGGAQRALVGGAAAAMGGPAALAAGAGLGRAANMTLNSNALRGLMIGEVAQPNQLMQLASRPEAANLLYRSAPVIAGR